MQEIEPIELANRMKQGPHTALIDVRSPGEFSQIHAEGAVNMPLETVTLERVQAHAAGRDVFFICKGGNRSKKACATVTLPTTSVIGGTDGWEKAGLPVVRGKGVMSLERQVRIGAGGLVLVGVLLGVALHPGFLGLAAFVGGGLIFAGVTDWCGMGLLLARMPWNQCTASSSNQGAACSRE